MIDCVFTLGDVGGAQLVQVFNCGQQVPLNYMGPMILIILGKSYNNMKREKKLRSLERDRHE